MLLARVVVLAVVFVLLAIQLVLMLVKPEGAGPRWLRVALLATSLAGVAWTGLVDLPRLMLRAPPLRPIAAQLEAWSVHSPRPSVLLRIGIERHLLVRRVAHTHRRRT